MEGGDDDLAKAIAASLETAREEGVGRQSSVAAEWQGQSSNNQQGQDDDGSVKMDEIVLPDDINAEEAKMLEAAMFGIPYQGPIPTSSNNRGDAHAAEASVLAQQNSTGGDDSSLVDMSSAPLVAGRRTDEAQGGASSREVVDEMDFESPHMSHNMQRSTSYGSNNSDKNMNDDVVLPDDINAEEAKMLEAAMFGIPYQGPIPTSSNNRGDTISSSINANPERTAERQIRFEQDRAYRASLEADRQKEAAKIKSEEEARQRIKEKEESERSKREKAELEEEEMNKLLSSRKAELPPEPTGITEGVVSIMIRLPDGTRCSRKFLLSHKVKFIFYFLDVHSGMKPGTYRLLTQFPRKVLDPNSESTMEDVGLTNKQEALFLEQIAE